MFKPSAAKAPQPPAFTMAPAATSSPSGSAFATLSFDTADRFRLVQFPFSVATAVGRRLRAGAEAGGWWPAGVQQERIYAVHAYEFKLKGWPFGGWSGDKVNIAGMRLVRDLLAFLHGRGWVVETSLSHEIRVGSTDTLIFRQRRRRGQKGIGRQMEGMGEKGVVVNGDGAGDGAGDGTADDADDVVIPPASEWLILSPELGDRLRVIYDAAPAPLKTSTELTAPEAMTSGGGEKAAAVTAGSSTSSEMQREGNYDELGVLIQALKESLTAVEYFQSGKWAHDSYEFKLKGWPWSEAGEKTVRAKKLVLAIVETLDRFGWRSYVTVQKRGTEKARGLDTWYFVREEGWDA